VTIGERCVAAFKTWHASWWKNLPNVFAHSIAQEAFYAGWDARGRDRQRTDSRS